MRVGVGRYVLHIPGARTLKDRRQVVRSFKDRVRARQPVSVAEIGDAQRLQVATFGVAVVSNDAEICHNVLNAVGQMAGSMPDAVLADMRTELIALGDDGAGLRGGSSNFTSSTAGFQVEPVRRKGKH